MTKQQRSVPVMQAVLDAVSIRLLNSDELTIRIPEICDETGVNYGSVYHHFGSREGVIDAAYASIFARLADEDVAMFDSLDHDIDSFEEYVAVMSPLVESVASAPGRKERRALRVRIVAAAATRPPLRRQIAAIQSRLNDELGRQVEVAQQRGWLRDDIPVRSLVVLIQMLIFGRSIDDVSETPVDEGDWAAAMKVLFESLLRR